MKPEDIQDALSALALFSAYYGSGSEGQALYHETLKTLRRNDNLLRTNIADAIDAYLHNKAVQSVARS